MGVPDTERDNGGGRIRRGTIGVSDLEGDNGGAGYGEGQWGRRIRRILHIITKRVMPCENSTKNQNSI